MGIVVQMVLLHVVADHRRWTCRRQAAIGTAIVIHVAVVLFVVSVAETCRRCCRHWNAWMGCVDQGAATASAATNCDRVDRHIGHRFGWSVWCVPTVVRMMRTAGVIVTHLFLIIWICIRMSVVHSLIVHIHQRIASGGRQMAAHIERIGREW